MLITTELDVRQVHPWVGLRRVGSQNSPSRMGLVGSGPVSKISNKYIINMQKIRRLLMIRSCNIAIFITVYLFIPFRLFGHCFCRMLTTRSVHNGEE